ncbi:hypothetical protein LCGC14_2481760, partial [marine sediment metagenome]
ARGWFNMLWENKHNRTYSADFEEYAESSFIKVLMYRWMEFSGMSTF